MKEHKLSPSKVLQDSLDALMIIEDPVLAQQNIDKYSKKKEDTKETAWQKGLSEEPDFDKRKIMVFEFLDNLGIDTSNWKENKELKSDKEVD